MSEERRLNWRRGAGIGSVALGVGIAAAAVMGPLGLRVIELRTSDHLENQLVGGEVVSLVVVAPAAAAAGVLRLREHRLAPALALGPALYAAYTYTTVVLGQEYARYPGNAERFFPLYAALVAGGVAIAAVAWSELRAAAIPVLPAGLRRTLAGIFLGIAGLFALAWAQQIRLVATGHPSIEYQEGPSLFWTIKLLDFGILIPLLTATGIGLLRRRPLAVTAACGLAPFVTCLAASIVAMAVAMELKDDPSSAPVMLAVLLPVVIGLGVVTCQLLCSTATETEDAVGGARDEAYYLRGHRGSAR